MPRPPRQDYAGAIWHLTARGVRKLPVFLDDHDYEAFLALLAEAVARYGWICHAYCLMPNHFHLLIETPRATLSDGMERLNGRYAQRFNLRHGVEGHVFERRFRSTSVRSEGHLLVLAGYIVLNPVRAGLCAHPAVWRWSSLLASLGRVPTPPFLSLAWLQTLFGDGRGGIAEEYERFVYEQLGARPPARASP